MEGMEKPLWNTRIAVQLRGLPTDPECVVASTTIQVESTTIRVTMTTIRVTMTTIG